MQQADAERLLAQAEWHDATLVTTEKDHARMRGTAGLPARLAEASRVLPIKLKFDDADAVRLASLLDTALTMSARLTVAAWPTDCRLIAGLGSRPIGCRLSH